jgi:hypothetical protein
MTTAWTFPTIITQYPEEGGENIHVPWDDYDNFSNMKSANEQSVGTIGNLYHIARSPQLDLTNKTYYVRTTGYNFTNLPSVVSGIEVRLRTKRGGRVTDDTVQLCLNGELIGENRATIAANPIKIYGSESDLWSSDITPALINDSSFGLVIRLRSHPSWPHNTAAFIDSVEIRIH